ncbi:hypothetical protein P152DRAFT_156624 [Eremomyces bilateralis CBS 781.70]|uniref:endo-1,3(4)-beta-glucanase n=1 Tax=Eremomyces bilateralis CBS 781.70 TaxID=1392243 RepID=A0A6G1FVC6_9PEZI|nr:uncharacterized protein P152DRAFT_156624 [Eremomyces bilateralis CBS 781.70]KAF1809680.1 hypothetical protein P152DRAFT_156624 [Eremomyces bilateralis CBS 781.70]
MLFSSFLLGLTLTKFGIAGYVLEDDYSPSNFFDKFDFFTARDPTHGFVQYVDKGTAQGSGLIKTSSDSIYMGVDTENETPNGRPSVRITSKKAYNSGLVILDLSHMPGSVCGTWPAFWMVGPDWPHGGEIDIIEGVNAQQSNSMALHTAPGCTINPSTVNRAFTGQIHTPNCDVKAQGQSANEGCSIRAPENHQATYGDDFNAADGGVYATEWTEDYIGIWHFQRNAIPEDINSGTPDPTKWGRPIALFHGGCDFSKAFQEQRIVFDTTFCGDWAGNVFSSDSTCAAKGNSCNAFVRDNPSAFTESFWRVRSLKVYQQDTHDGFIGLSPSEPLSSSQSISQSSRSSSSSVGSSVSSGNSSSPVTATTFVTFTRPASVPQSPSKAPPGSDSAPAIVTKTEIRTVYGPPPTEVVPLEEERTTVTQMVTVYLKSTGSSS